MKYRILFTSILFLLGFNIHASHIVGGELELSRVRGRGYVYQISLKMYVDLENANTGVIASETEAWVGIFDKLTNVRMTKVKLIRNPGIKNVNYGPSCAANPIQLLRTGLLTFSESIEFDSTIYTRPEGYYIVWERCCRNSIIENILNPGGEAMAFYLEFPPLYTNGASFHNNTPHFKQISGDYLCKNKAFKFDFSGTDFNGDSLVYRVSTPLTGSLSVGNPTTDNPLSAPYDTVTWLPPYGKHNEIPGNPPFYINPQTGEIDFTPTEEGLFVISVDVEEYRDGQKIGMVKRDFQFMVVTCSPNASNSIDLKLPDGSLYSAIDTLEINLAKDTCFSILVSDSNIIKNFSTSENISLKVKSNLPPGILTVAKSVVINQVNDTATVQLCFDACNKLFINADTMFNIEITCTDAPKCPMALAFYDTLRLKILYKPQLNVKPEIGIVPTATTINALVGQQISFDIYGTDSDPADIIYLSANADDFILQDRGMSFNNVSGSDSISSRFTWTPACEDVEKEPYKIYFLIDDNSCIPHNEDTITVIINLEDKTTTLPGISPTNLITPNGDGLNDVFEIPNIPDGNCDYYFKKVTIYNRWGAKVYENTKPDFKWDPDKMSNGIYYYLIDINKKEFRGWIEVRK